MPDEVAGAHRLSIRPYGDGDEEAILDLFARCFPHAPRRSEHFHWKYLRSPFGNEKISLTFDSEGRLVGHYAGYPVPFRAFGRDVLAHQIGDTMTDVAARHLGRGPTSVLGRTAHDFFERFCEGRVAFNYGFNVSNIQRFSVRFLRSDCVEAVTYRARDLRGHPLRPIGAFERWRRGYRVEIVSDTGPEWDDLFARAADSYRFCIRRDARYVTWRYLQCPGVSYRLAAVRRRGALVGWIAFRIRDDRFTWGDALFDPSHPDAPEILLRHLVPATSVNLIEGWFPPRPLWFDAVLRELHFETRPEPQDLSLMCTPFTWTDVVPRMREDLYYTWGDSDLF